MSAASQLLLHCCDPTILLWVQFFVKLGCFWDFVLDKQKPGSKKKNTAKRTSETWRYKVKRYQ
jgi:hypothetical protein